MKWSLALVVQLVFLAQRLNAEPVASSVTAGVVQPLSATVEAASLSPTAALVASPEPSLAPSPAPTPIPTPTPLAVLPGPSSVVRLVDPSWAFAAKAGASLPLGELAFYNTAGPGLSLDLYYHASATVSVDSFLGFASQAYKAGGNSPPMNNVGLGSKLLYNLAQIEEVTWYAGGGLAVYYDQRTKQVVRPVVSNAPALFDPVPDSSFGLGVLAVLGGRYQSPGGWGVILELNLTNINLAGGTSDNLLLAQPMLGYCYAL